MVPGHGDDAHVHLFSHGSLSSRFSGIPPMVRAYSPTQDRRASGNVSQPAARQKQAPDRGEHRLHQLDRGDKAGGRYFSPS